MRPHLKALQLLLDLGGALGQLRAHEVDRAQRLLERKVVFDPTVALQTLGSLLDAGAQRQQWGRIQLVNATVWLDISAGVCKQRVFLGPLI